MKMTRVAPAAILLLLASAARSQTVSWTPSEAFDDESVVFDISGTWNDSCVPFAHDVRVSQSSIEILAAVECSQTCLFAVTPYTGSTPPLAPLPAGLYPVFYLEACATPGTPSSQWDPIGIVAEGDLLVESALTRLGVFADGAGPVDQSLPVLEVREGETVTITTGIDESLVACQVDPADPQGVPNVADLEIDVSYGGTGDTDPPASGDDLSLGGKPFPDSGSELAYVTGYQVGAVDGSVVKQVEFTFEVVADGLEEEPEHALISFAIDELWSPDTDLWCDGQRIDFLETRAPVVGFELIILDAAPAAPPEADFSWTPTSPSVGQPVTFVDRSTGTVTSREWSFGDGSFGTGAQTSHSYDRAGNYPVTLTVAGPLGSSSVTREVSVDERPLVELIAGVTATGEGRPEVRVGVRRTGTVGQVQVQVASVGGTATQGSDYSFTSQRLTWRSGESGVQWLSVPLIDDDEPEGVETIVLGLTSVTGSLIGRRFGRIAIQDDDYLPEPEETVSDGGRQPWVASYSPNGLQDSRRRQVVVWEGDDGSGTGIFARLLGPDGQPLGPRFQVNSRRRGDQRNPRVVFDGNGRFAVVWQEDPETRSGIDPRAAGGSLWGQFFGLDGEEASEEIEVTDEGSPEEPTAAVDGSGDLVVTWEDEGEIVTQEVTDAGPTGAPISLGPGVEPEVARTATGSYAVIWQGDSGGGAGAIDLRNGGSLFGSFFGTDGEPVAESQPIETEGAEEPAAGAGASEDYVVVFVKQGGDGDRDVFATVYGVNGTSKVARFQVNAVDAGDQRAPAVAVNAAGDFVVAWESDVGVHARFFDRRARPVGGDVAVALSSAAVAAVRPAVSLDDEDRVRVVWERRLANGASDGVSSRIIEPAVSAGCEPDASTLCLQDDRFEVRVHWRTPQGESGEARAERLTGDTGYFWFFRDTNVEMLVKVLDGCGFNDRYWVFAGGLTNVETEIVVSDSVTGKSRRYRNPLNTEFLPIQDTSAFRGCDAEPAASAAVTRSAGAVAAAATLPAAPRGGLFDLLGGLERSVAEALDERGGAAAAVESSVMRAGSCVPTTRRLCLGGGRFAVEADWRTAQGTSGSGRAVALTADTGLFWFFNESNVEMVVKVLDGCGLNQRYWVFAGGLTNVEVEWRVTDTTTGETVEYVNPLDRPFLPVQDTDAIASCP